MEMLLLKFYLLLELIDFDLKFNTTFPFWVSHLEDLKLIRIILLPKLFVLFSKISFNLFVLKHLNLKTADFFLQDVDPLSEDILLAHCILIFIGYFRLVPFL